MPRTKTEAQQRAVALAAEAETLEASLEETRERAAAARREAEKVEDRAAAARRAAGLEG